MRSPQPQRPRDSDESRPRLLAVVSRFKWQHIDYLAALAERFELAIASSGEGHEGAVEYAIRIGLRITPIGRIEEIGEREVGARLARVVDEWQPAAIHLMYYYHEPLVPIVRRLIGDETLLVFECRDPLTTLRNAGRGTWAWHAEHQALLESDAQIFVSRALRTYYQQLHGLQLEQTSIIVPHSFAESNAGPPSEKLSARDRRTHLAIVGTAHPAPESSRWYGDIIRRLVGLGFVVHSHFHEVGSLEAYRALDRELPDYHHHPTVPFRKGTVLSELISRYDLMGVFYELDVPHSEGPTLAVCLPHKAVCGWFHGAIPAVCFPHYRGLRDWIDELGIGFVADGWDDLASLLCDPGAIARATDRCLAVRYRFTNEWNADRIQEFVVRWLAQRRR